MSTVNTTTIGINLGARYAGIAVIVGTELRDWRVRVIRGDTLIDKFQSLTSTLARLIDTYAPTAVALKQPHRSRTSPNLDRLQLEAKEFLRQHGVKVLEITLGQIKTSLLPSEKTNKKKLAEIMIKQYPILMEEWKREVALRRPYRMVMFEAVALAAVCSVEASDATRARG